MAQTHLRVLPVPTFCCIIPHQPTHQRPSLAKLTAHEGYIYEHTRIPFITTGPLV